TTPEGGLYRKTLGASGMVRPALRTTPAGLLARGGQRGSQVVVVSTFGDAEPGHAAVAEAHVAVVDLLEARVAVAEFLEHFVGSLESSVHDAAREGAPHGARSGQATQGVGVVGIVVADHLASGRARRHVDQRLVGLGQLVVG